MFWSQVRRVHHRWKAGPALLLPDAGTALDAAAAAVPADTGAAAQAASGGKPWDASDYYDSHAAAAEPPPTTDHCRRTPHCRPARPRRRRRRCRRLASMDGGVAAQRRQRRPTHGADLHNPRRQDRRDPILVMRQEGHRMWREHPGPRLCL